MRRLILLRDYFILFVCSLLPFWRFSWSTKGIFNIADSCYPLDVDYIFKSFLFTWNPDWGTGFDITANYVLLDILAPKYLLALLGFSLAQGQIIYFVGVYFLLGFGMYFFVTNFFNFQNQTLKSLAGISSGLFYMFNFCSFQFTMGVPHILISFALFPVLLILLIRVLHERNFFIQLRKAIIFGIVSMFFLTADVSHAYLFFLISLFFLIIYSLAMRLDLNIIVRSLSLIAFLVVLFNIWWILPLYEYMFLGGMIEQVAVPEYNKVVLQSMNAVVNVFEILRLTITQNQFSEKVGGIFAWPSYIRGFYRSPFSIIFFLILFSFTLLTLRDKRYSKKLIILSAIGLIAIALSWGSHLHTFIWKIYPWCIEHVPCFSVVRNFTKFRVIILFWYVSMFGIFIALLYEKLSTKLRTPILKKFLPIILIFGALFIILLNSPQYIGGNLGGRMVFFQPPDYYSQANEWLNKQGPYYRTATLPQMEQGELYKWGPNYYMITIVLNAFNRPMLVQNYTKQSKEIINIFANEEKETKSHYAGKIMKLLGIKYIMFRNDLLPISLGNARARYIKNLPLYLDRQENISFERNFGSLNFYCNHYYNENHIYASGKNN